MTVLQAVPTNYSAQVWPSVEAFLEKTEKHGLGNHTLEQMRMQVLTGNWVMVACTDEGAFTGAYLLQFINHPNSRVAFITCCGGKNVTTKDCFAQLNAIAESMGATKIQACARPAIVRMLQKVGFEQITAVVELKR